MKKETEIQFRKRLGIKSDMPGYLAHQAKIIADIQKHCPEILKRPPVKPMEFRQRKAFIRTNDMVKEIKARHRDGESFRSIGRSFGIHNAKIKEICLDIKPKKPKPKRKLVF